MSFSDNNPIQRSNRSGWYVQPEPGKHQGPFEFEVLKDDFESGVFEIDALVYHHAATRGTWIAAEQVPEFGVIGEPADCVQIKAVPRG